jgi:hypothetical protein
MVSEIHLGVADHAHFCRPDEQSVYLAITYITLILTVRKSTPLLTAGYICLVTKLSSQDQVSSLSVVEFTNTGRVVCLALLFDLFDYDSFN